MNVKSKLWVKTSSSFSIAKAWVEWDLGWEAYPGRYSLRAHATDDQGNTQPNRIPLNEEGYNHWAVVTHPIKVV